MLADLSMSEPYHLPHRTREHGPQSGVVDTPLSLKQVAFKKTSISMLRSIYHQSFVI
jgi:hypothetical protein